MEYKISEYAKINNVTIRTVWNCISNKVIGEFQYPIEVCSTPLALTMFDTIKLNFNEFH